MLVSLVTIFFYIFTLDCVSVLALMWRQIVMWLRRFRWLRLYVCGGDLLLDRR